MKECIICKRLKVVKEAKHAIVKGSLSGGIKEWPVCSKHARMHAEKMRIKREKE